MRPKSAVASFCGSNDTREQIRIADCGFSLQKSDDAFDHKQRDVGNRMVDRRAL